MTDERLAQEGHSHIMTPVSLRDQLLEVAQSQAPGFVDLEPIVKVVAREVLGIALKRIASVDFGDEQQVLFDLLTEIEIVSPQVQEQKDDDGASAPARSPASFADAETETLPDREK